MRAKVAISIVVPCWNVEAYLHKAMDSLIGQTLCDIEIICIDDKSTDGSLEILREYEEKDKRVKVIAFPENRGVSAARNEGMKIALGEYIGFLDPDDYVDLDFYENLYISAGKTEVDIVKGNAKVVGFDGKMRRFGRKSHEILKNRAYFNSAFSSAIYKRRFLEADGIDFPADLITGEDPVFLIKAVMLAKEIELVDNESYYFYVRRDNSLDSMQLSEVKIKTNIIAFNMMVDFLNKIELDRKIYSAAFTIVLNFLINDIFSRNNQIKVKMMVTAAGIELFNKCKYQDDYANQNPICGDFLKREDEAGLFFHLLQPKKNKYFRLFGLIPILKIKNKGNKQIWKLFDMIPLWSKQEMQCKTTYKLFGLILILVKSTKGKV